MDLPEWLTETLDQLPCTRTEWREAWSCWVLWVTPRPDPKPRDKWFGMVIPDKTGRVLLNLKGDPEVNALRKDELAWVETAWHMNKRHWVSVVLEHPDFEPGRAAQLVEDAWDVTVAGYPVRIRDALLALR